MMGLGGGMGKESVGLLGKIKNVPAGIEEAGRRVGTSAGESAATALSKTLGPALSEYATAGGKTFGAESAQAFQSGIEKELPALIAKAKGHATAGAIEQALDLIRKGTVGAGVGALTGAAASGLGTEGKDIAGGGVRGAGGGLLGSMIGAAFQKRLGVNPLAARMGGATIGGGLAGYLGRKEQPVHKYAGVTLDWYDDKGSFIKECFPEADKLPDIIKAANVKPQETVPNEQFALVAQNNGHILRKYACTDPGTTAMSVMYFLKHGEKLPEEAVKVAADNLFEACIKYGILPPEPLTKLALDPVAANTQATANMVNTATSNIQNAIPNTKPPSPPKPEGISKEGAIDITGQSPKPKFTELPSFDEDYAVITDDGKRMYPIHDWDHIKQACDYWVQESRRMDPQIRRQFATKVASKALDMGYPIRDLNLLDVGSPHYADNGHVKASLEMRKVAMPGPDNKIHRDFLDDLMDKMASLNPEVFAECVRRFDVMNHLDSGWDHVMPSPWESTFGLQKIAKVVWESGADRLTDYDLNNLVRNHSGELQEEWHHALAQKMVEDPVGTFNSLSLPQKKIISRLANDKASQGGSVMASENDVSP